ncbi:glycosyl transferase [candidate division WWE3 bacterium CG08_land_8_20_14_0_20_41_15]|uniref:Glycosyl transferase n=1 Tax=candidate division WWE3 bacterium CG08_land_8_20_14_0_20_41_15 TaxID=1975086 RepID=A0A2H0X9S1_UNCKA|nr:MAG: glycosyl transferase [candidate division WWE3 bacterium CG08_land_8_20_14_0_20_41_15]
MKIALVHDSFIQSGGAESVFEAIFELYPEADIFTSIYDKKFASRYGKIKASRLLQRLPFKDKIEKFAYFLMPLVFESFDFSGYDLVISSSARFSHGITTSSKTCHICYMHSPARFLWEPFDYFSSNLIRLITSPINLWLRIWDQAAVERVDAIFANSNYTAEKIKKFYNRDSTIVYPFQSKECRQPVEKRKDFFLIVSRLSRWKQTDLAILVANKLKIKLVVVGEGEDLPRLKRMAGKTVTFTGRISDSNVVDLMSRAKALIFPQKEDFGITAVEAMVCKCPVIAFSEGGALETVINEETGIFFNDQTVVSLEKAVLDFDKFHFKGENCVRRGKEFSKEIFLKTFSVSVKREYEKFLQSHQEIN